MLPNDGVARTLDGLLLQNIESRFRKKDLNYLKKNFMLNLIEKEDVFETYTKKSFPEKTNILQKGTKLLVV